MEGADVKAAALSLVEGLEGRALDESAEELHVLGLAQRQEQLLVLVLRVADLPTPRCGLIEGRPQEVERREETVVVVVQARAREIVELLQGKVLHDHRQIRYGRHGLSLPRGSH